MGSTRDALAEIERGGSARPTLVLARRLDDATSTSFVHVDRNGRVRSPARYQFLSRLNSLAYLGLLAIPIAYGVWLGPLGLILGGGATALALTRVRKGPAAHRAAQLLAHNRVDEAEPLLEDIVRSRFVHRQTRGLAHYNLGVCRMLRDDHEGALAHVREARRRFAQALWSQSVFAPRARYLEVQLLVNLDRIDEARNRLDAIGDEPTGEYFQMSHWTTALYVALGEGGHGMPDDELFVRARKGLSMTTGVALTGLTAWGYLQNGDDDQAQHLLRVAFERLDDDAITQVRIAHALPKLHAWMHAHRPDGDPYTAGEADSYDALPDPDDSPA